MKLKYEFAVRNIAGEYILVPMGAGALQFSGMVTTNAVGAAVCDCLKENTTPQAILENLLQEFDIDEATAKADMEAFLADLTKAGLLEE
ncbi:MAG: PqqD family protein [Faecousia sp.]